LWRAALGGAAALVIAFAMCTACFPLLLAAPIVYVIGELVFAALYIQKYQILSSSAVAAPQRPLDYCPLEFFEKATEHLKQVPRGRNACAESMHAWARRGDGVQHHS
jgi:hypothetical protein